MNDEQRIRVQQFLYKALHNAFVIGHKWSRIPNFEMRAQCSICGEIESMQHRLLECNAIKRHLIWNEAKEFWPDDPQEWPAITIG
ncbi:hypothetical protein BJV74DRAFT_785242 [Russula compacta]|nr:hypothetical protein BJV74DRAFT_785242 [Russula compacta]